MTTFRNIQDEVLQILHGYGLAQPRAAFLTAPLSDSATTFTVDTVANLDAGLAEIDNELVFIASVDRSSNTVTLSPDGRGFYGSTPQEHVASTRVTFAPTWSRARVKGAINDTIVSTHPTLFGIGQAQFIFNPSTTTYSLPAEAEKVLAVAAETLGPSSEFQRITSYSFNSVTPVDQFATTNSITLHEPAAPGRTVTVTYAKQPSPLEEDADLFTDSGLRESAKLAVIYGACAQLISFMDVSRLPVDTAQADEMDERSGLGMASRIGGQLQLRFDMELEKERQRLRQTTPVTISRRKR